MLVVGQEIVLSEVLQKPIANQRLQYLADHRREAHWTIVAGFLPVAFLVYRPQLTQRPVKRYCSRVREIS